MKKLLRTLSIILAMIAVLAIVITIEFHGVSWSSLNL